MFEIRKAARSEAFAIRRMIWQVGINPFGLDWRRFIVAVDLKGKVIGCAQLKPHKGGAIELASVAVSKPYRSQGIAGTLIRHLLKKQHKPVYLTCRENLTGYYERFGFTVVNEESYLPPYFNKVRRFYKKYAAFAKPKIGLAIMVCRDCDPF
jgi:N-acetylglutamate synthase-like GNAT family acetyltransferase